MTVVSSGGIIFKEKYWKPHREADLSKIILMIRLNHLNQLFQWIVVIEFTVKIYSNYQSSSTKNSY